MHTPLHLSSALAPPAPAVALPVWIGFHLALLVLLAAELTFARWGLARVAPEARTARARRNAIAATLMWAAAAAALGLYVHRTLHGSSATEFLAGYALEESLSIDNLFLFLLLFRTFGIPPNAQPRALFWGVLGAILLRGAFIAAGLGLLERFAWISYVFGAVLLAAALRLVWPKADHVEETVTRPRWLDWIARIHPVSSRTDVFFTREPLPGHPTPRPMITMLMLALVAIECTDVIFAFDSIPAVLSVTRQPFLAYTSNILAVMSLRSLYFLLAEALKNLRYLHIGLAAILAFAAGKMLLAHWVEIGPLPSLAVIVVILAATVMMSFVHRRD